MISSPTKAFVGRRRGKHQAANKSSLVHVHGSRRLGGVKPNELQLGKGGPHADQFEVSSSRLISIRWQFRVTQLDPKTSLVSGHLLSLLTR
jgi:hypothetical protein